jgi:hypothetical protein
MTKNTPRSAQRVVGQQMVSSPLESHPAARRVPGHHMNHAPRGTVRRSAEGALLVREFRGDNEGWKLVPQQSGRCAFFPDRELDPAWLDWPIVCCPDATFHEQDNIRRAHGIRGVAASARYTSVHEPYGSEVVDKQLPRAATEEPLQWGYLGGFTMTETVGNLMEANLLGVFNEHDAQRRALAIESTYARDIRWTDGEGTSVGREGTYRILDGRPVPVR